MNKLGRGGGLVHIALGAGGQGLEDGLVVCAASGHDNAQVRARRLQAGHHIKQVLSGAAAQEHQVNIGPRAQLRQGGRNQFQVRFGIKEGLQSNESQRIAFHHSDPDNRLLGPSSSFHPTLL